MKVLLQNKKTKLYMKEAGSWTRQIEDAYAFKNSGEAIDFAFQQEFEDVDIIFWFQAQNYSFSLPFQTDLNDEPARSIPIRNPGERDQV
jgi:hypothetical protein